MFFGEKHSTTFINHWNAWGGGGGGLKLCFLILLTICTHVDFFMISIFKFKLDFSSICVPKNG
jgi:hypothetical protein